MSTKRLIGLASILLTATPALAHTGIGSTDGFAHGFSHPLGGLDHVLAMGTVGLLAAQLGGRALWLLPLAFVGMMAIGGALGMAGIGLPYVEIGIGLSTVVFGALVGLSLDLPVILVAIVVGAFAVFHGHAHGAEMPETASGLAYGAGFVLATALLHLGGIGAGLALPRLVGGRKLPVQVAGGAAALAGIAILAA